MTAVILMAALGTGDARFAEVRFVDAATHRGIPLVEAETVHRLRFVSDNAGRIAIGDPDLVGREIGLTLKSHGYAVKKDFFGFPIVRVVLDPARPVEIALERTQLSERLCRLTGEGRWCESEKLGIAPPVVDVPALGRVAGQDSIQPVVHDGRWFCFWGDTLRLEHPLGLFRMAGATVDLARVTAPAWDLGDGLPYRYFVDGSSGFARATIPIADRPEGVVWVNGFCDVADATGKRRMVAWYSRRASLEKELEQGLAVWNDERDEMEPVKQLPAGDWRHPCGHPIEFEEAGVKWLLFGSPNCDLRAPANYEALLDPASYEAFTCEGDGDAPDLDERGAPCWRWQKEKPPLDSKRELAWIGAKKLAPEQARFVPCNAADPAERIWLHSGTVRWNEWRRRFVLIACQAGGTSSALGEIWYAEARHPCGPFAKAVKIATHDRMSLYNVCHHALLDRDGGRTIHFEGTYTNDFSGNPDATPRYQYNQLLFRLDLAREELQAAWSE